MSSDELIGVVTGTKYRRESKKFQVLSVDSSLYGEVSVVVFTDREFPRDERFVGRGTWESSPKFGRQFKAWEW